MCDDQQKTPGSRRYYQLNNDPTITGLWECCHADDPANTFDICGNRYRSGTWPSWFRNNSTVHEITKQQAAALILTARAKQFRETLNVTYHGEVVHVGDRNVTAVFEVADTLVEYIIPVESFGLCPKVGDALLGTTQIHHLGALRLQGWQPPREHKRKNVVPLPRSF